MARPYAVASATALSLLLAGASLAQTYRDSGGSVVPGIVPIGGDGSGPLFTSSNPAKVSGTFSATLSGFQPTPSYSTQSVTTASAAYPLPTGTVVIVYNTGSNPITIKLGGSSVSVTAGQADVVPAGGWMAFTVGSATDYAVVGNGGASTVVVSGGSGLPTGAGGGGGAGGTVAQGAPALAGSAWPVSETLAGSQVSSSNPVPISFGSGVSLPSFASPPTVNIGSAPTVSVTGAFWQATQPVSLVSLPALSTGSNVIGAVTQSAGPWAVTWSGQAVAVSSLPSLSAGSNTIGGVTQSGTWSTGRTWSLSSGSDSVTATISGTPAVSISGTPSVSFAPAASGGFSKAFYAGLVGTIQYPKTSPGQVVRVQCDNIAGASAAYVQFFDAASGAALGTSVVDYIPLPSGGTGGFTLSGAGVQFSNGIGLGAATTPNGSTAATAATVNCAVTYK